MRLIGLARRMPIQAVERKIYPFNYESYDVATYFILLERKHRIGTRNFRNVGVNIDRVRQFGCFSVFTTFRKLLCITSCCSVFLAIHMLFLVQSCQLWSSYPKIIGGRIF